MVSTSRGIAIALTAIVVVTLTSCADNTSGAAAVNAAATSDGLAAKFGACQPLEEAGDFAPPVSILAIAEKWLEVTSLPSGDQLSSFSPDQGQTMLVKLGVKEFDAQANGFVGPSRDSDIAVHWASRNAANRGIDRQHALKSKRHRHSLVFQCGAVPAWRQGCGRGSGGMRLYAAMLGQGNT